MYFFLARGLVAGAAHPDVDEIVETVTLSVSAVIAAIQTKDIVDLKTIAAIGWYRGAM